jgi:hypothetical protein
MMQLLLNRSALYHYTIMRERLANLSALFKLVGELQASAYTTLVWLFTPLRFLLVLSLLY